MTRTEISDILALERKALVLTALQSRIGEARGMHVAELSSVTMLHARICRKAIELLRLDGVQLCGKPETGYYIAATAEENARWRLHQFSGVLFRFLEARARVDPRLRQRRAEGLDAR